MMTREQAERELTEALRRNPGPWGAHSHSVANNARQIAEKTDDLDSEKAWILGLLHDIGRRFGITGMAHTLDGYDYLMGLGHPEIARVCLTHSFPIKGIETSSARWMCRRSGCVFWSGS